MRGNSQLDITADYPPTGIFLRVLNHGGLIHLIKKISQALYIFGISEIYLRWDKIAFLTS